MRVPGWSLKRLRGPRVTGFATLALCLAIAALDPAPLAPLRNTLFDAYQRLMPRERQFAGAVVVAIDEVALQSRGQWPWPRALVADLLDAIGRAGPLAIRTCGGQSLLKSLPLERLYRDSRCGALMLPWTAELCLDRIGREALYEPGEADD